jgi:flagellar hook-associated protein 3 FlgL
MATVRMTQSMLGDRALSGMQAGLNRLSRVQEQLTTGRVINRPSDDPTGATSAMRIRTSLADQKQFVRNADDGLGWLNQIDATLSSMTDQVRRGRDIALQGANTGAMGPEAREALATEVDQLRSGLLSSANATYLDRPVFGGITDGPQAYDPTTGAYVGVAGAVVRTVADGSTIRVDVDGPSAFGPAGATVFDHLADLSVALRAGNSTGISAAVDLLATDGKRVTNTQADVGARTARIEQARTAATDAQLTLTSSLSEVENVDIAKATVDLQLQEVAYQAALGATARVMQPSLLDFLR